MKHVISNVNLKHKILFSSGIKINIQAPARGVKLMKISKLSKKKERIFIIKLSLGRFEQPTLRLSNYNRKFGFINFVTNCTRKFLFIQL